MTHNELFFKYDTIIIKSLDARNMFCKTSGRVAFSGKRMWLHRKRAELFLLGNLLFYSHGDIQWVWVAKEKTIWGKGEKTDQQTIYIT